MSFVLEKNRSEGLMNMMESETVKKSASQTSQSEGRALGARMLEGLK